MIDAISDLSEYFGDKDEIKRLNKQVDMIAGFYKSYYNAEISKLKLQLINSYGRTREMKASRDKIKSHKVRSSILLLTLKKKGFLLMSNKQIANVLFLSKKTVEVDSARLVVSV